MRPVDKVQSYSSKIHSPASNWHHYKPSGVHPLQKLLHINRVKEVKCRSLRNVGPLAQRDINRLVFEC